MDGACAERAVQAEGGAGGAGGSRDMHGGGGGGMRREGCGCGSGMWLHDVSFDANDFGHYILHALNATASWYPLAAAVAR